MGSTDRKEEIEIGDLVCVKIGAYEYDAFVLTVIPNQNLAYEVHFVGYSRELDGLVSKKSVRKYGENPALRREVADKPPPEADIKTRPQLSPMSRISRKRPGSPAPKKPKVNTKHKKKKVARKLQYELNVKPTEEEKEKEVVRLLQYEASRLEVPLPDILVLWLGVDEDYICRKHKLIKLPARVDVDTYLLRYVAYRESNKISSDEHKDLMGMVYSLKGYFIKYLPSFLFPFEQQKYDDVIKMIPYSSFVCKLYSVMHLVRMIARMHWILEREGVDADRTGSFFEQLTNLTSNMEEYETKLFSREDYIDPPPGYEEDYGDSDEED